MDTQSLLVGLLVVSSVSLLISIGACYLTSRLRRKPTRFDLENPTIVVSKDGHVDVTGRHSINTPVSTADRPHKLGRYSDFQLPIIKTQEKHIHGLTADTLCEPAAKISNDQLGYDDIEVIQTSKPATAYPESLTDIPHIDTMKANDAEQRLQLTHGHGGMLQHLINSTSDLNDGSVSDLTEDEPDLALDLVRYSSMQLDKNRLFNSYSDMNDLSLTFNTSENELFHKGRFISAKKELEDRGVLVNGMLKSKRYSMLNEHEAIKLMECAVEMLDGIVDHRLTY
jgi:hypothetical protein